MKYQDHANAAVVVIKALAEFKFNPQEKIAVLKTAAAMIEHEVQATGMAIILKNALENKE